MPLEQPLTQANPVERYDYEKWNKRGIALGELKASQSSMQNQFEDNKYAFSADAIEGRTPPKLPGGEIASGFQVAGKGMQTVGTGAIAGGAIIGGPTAPVVMTIGALVAGLGVAVDALGGAIAANDEAAYQNAMTEYEQLSAQYETAWLEMEGRRAARKTALSSLQSDTSIYA